MRGCAKLDYTIRAVTSADTKQPGDTIQKAAPRCIDFTAETRGRCDPHGDTLSPLHPFTNATDGAAPEQIVRQALVKLNHDHRDERLPAPSGGDGPRTIAQGKREGACFTRDTGQLPERHANKSAAHASAACRCARGSKASTCAIRPPFAYRWMLDALLHRPLRINSAIPKRWMREKGLAPPCRKQYSVGRSIIYNCSRSASDCSACCHDAYMSGYAASNGARVRRRAARAAPRIWTLTQPGQGAAIP